MISGVMVLSCIDGACGPSEGLIRAGRTNPGVRIASRGIRLRTEAIWRGGSDRRPVRNPFYSHLTEGLNLYDDVWKRVLVRYESGH